MSLLDHAKELTKGLLLDEVTAMGTTVRIINPEGRKANVTGRWQDIAIAIDNETGLPVTSRTVSLAVSIDQLKTVGFIKLPYAISDSSSKPWVVEYPDRAFSFKIIESQPDRTLNVLILKLEEYRSKDAS